MEIKLCCTTSCTTFYLRLFSGRWTSKWLMSHRTPSACLLLSWLRCRWTLFTRFRFLLTRSWFSSCWSLQLLLQILFAQLPNGLLVELNEILLHLALEAFVLALEVVFRAADLCPAPCVIQRRRRLDFVRKARHDGFQLTLNFDTGRRKNCFCCFRKGHFQSIKNDFEMKNGQQNGLLRFDVNPIQWSVKRVTRRRKTSNWKAWNQSLKHSFLRLTRSLLAEREKKKKTSNHFLIASLHRTNMLSKISITSGSITVGYSNSVLIVLKRRLGRCGERSGEWRDDH